MSNRQLGWDDMQVRDRIAPPDEVQAEQAEAAEKEAERERPTGDDKWIPPGNAGQGSRKD